MNNNYIFKFNQMNTSEGDYSFEIAPNSPQGYKSGIDIPIIIESLANNDFIPLTLDSAKTMINALSAIVDYIERS